MFVIKITLTTLLIMLSLAAKDGIPYSHTDFERISETSDHEMGSGDCEKLGIDSKVDARLICCSTQVSKHCSAVYSVKMREEGIEQLVFRDLKGVKIAYQQGCQCLDVIPDYVCGSKDCLVSVVYNQTNYYTHDNYGERQCNLQPQKMITCKIFGEYHDHFSDKRLLHSTKFDADVLQADFTSGVLYLDLKNNTIDVLVISGSSGDFRYSNLYGFLTLKICDASAQGSIKLRWFYHGSWSSSELIENRPYDYCLDVSPSFWQFWRNLQCSKGTTFAFVLIVWILIFIILFALSMSILIIGYKIASKVLKCMPGKWKWCGKKTIEAASEVKEHLLSRARRSIEMIRQGKSKDESLDKIEISTVKYSTAKDYRDSENQRVALKGEKPCIPDGVVYFSGKELPNHTGLSGSEESDGDEDDDIAVNYYTPEVSKTEGALRKMSKPFTLVNPDETPYEVARQELLDSNDYYKAPTKRQKIDIKKCDLCSDEYKKSDPSQAKRICQDLNSQSVPYSRYLMVMYNNSKEGLKRFRIAYNIKSKKWILALVLMLPIVLACENVYTLSSTEMVCTNDGNFKNCTVKTSSEITMTGLGSTSCISILDPSGNLISDVNIKISDFSKVYKTSLSYYTCKYNTIFSTPRWESCSTDYYCEQTGSLYNGAYIHKQTWQPRLGTANCAQAQAKGFWCPADQVMCYYGIKYVDSCKGSFASVYDTISSWFSPEFEISLKDSNGESSQKTRLPLLGSIEFGNDKNYKIARKSEQPSSDPILNKKLMIYDGGYYLCSASDINQPSRSTIGDFQSSTDAVRMKTTDGVLSRIYESYNTMTDSNRCFSTEIYPPGLNDLSSCVNITEGSLMSGLFWRYLGNGEIAAALTGSSSISLILQINRDVRVQTTIDTPKVETLNMTCSGFSGGVGQVEVIYTCKTNFETSMIEIGEFKLDWQPTDLIICDSTERKFYFTSNSQQTQRTFLVQGKTYSVSCTTPNLLEVKNENFTVISAEWDGGDSGKTIPWGSSLWFDSFSNPFKIAAISISSAITVIIVAMIVLASMKICCGCFPSFCSKYKEIKGEAD